MNLAITFSPAYSLIDSGKGKRLERFGENYIVRPDSTCIWNTQESAETWKSAAAVYVKKDGTKVHWALKGTMKEPWHFVVSLPNISKEKNYKITCELRLPSSKNVGIFPEQMSNWFWMSEVLRKSTNRRPKVLNLFGYTGAATLVAALHGADVCHVDASQTSVSWAKKNQLLSGLEKAPIRWIVDDCLAFMKREIRRGVKYDGIIMDPPAYGRDPKGNPFSFETQIQPLLKAAKALLSEKPLFFVLNGYAIGYPADVIGNLVRENFPNEDVECGELQIMQEDNSRIVSCSIYARFNPKY
jgi:23S rRNA (cytosine1962-C5)-methyltransferase